MEMILISLNIPEHQLEGLEDLIRSKRYSNRSEAIREGISLLLKEEEANGEEPKNEEPAFRVVKEVKDNFDTVRGRTIVRGECPFCDTPFATTPKLAQAIRRRGCLKCHKKVAEKRKNED